MSKENIQTPLQKTRELVADYLYLISLLKKKLISQEIFIEYWKTNNYWQAIPDSVIRINVAENKAFSRTTTLETNESARPWEISDLLAYANKCFGLDMNNAILVPREKEVKFVKSFL